MIITQDKYNFRSSNTSNRTAERNLQPYEQDTIISLRVLKSGRCLTQADLYDVQKVVSFARLLLA